MLVCFLGWSAVGTRAFLLPSDRSGPHTDRHRQQSERQWRIPRARGIGPANAHRQVDGREQGLSLTMGFGNTRKQRRKQRKEEQGHNVNHHHHRRVSRSDLITLLPTAASEGAGGGKVLSGTVSLLGKDEGQPARISIGPGANTATLNFANGTVATINTTQLHQRHDQTLWLAVRSELQVTSNQIGMMN